MTHWSTPDVPWGPAASDVPTQAQWHHLAYTYDGTTASVFVDGALKNQKSVAPLKTTGGQTINLGAERVGTGFTLFATLAIAIVRIHDGHLTAAQVKANYENELPRFQ
jgi:hypothetical protein